MTNTPWLKLYNTMPTDDKIVNISEELEIQRVIVIGAWSAILCTANSSSVRGCLAFTEEKPMSVRVLARKAGLDDVQLMRVILGAFVDYNMLDFDGNFYSVKRWPLYGAKASEIKPKRVYLMESMSGSKNTRYKIGISANPEKRLAGIATSMPDPLRIICFSEKSYDASQHEAKLHSRYSEVRVGGEWFELTESQVGETVAYILGVKGDEQ